MFHELYALPVVIVRLFMTYGPGQAPEKLIPSVILSLAGGVAPKLSRGNFRGDWIYIDDAIDGIISAESSGKFGKTIDIGTGVVSSIKDVVAITSEIIGTKTAPIWGAIPDRPNENEVAAHTVRTAKLIGWQAKTPLEAGLKKAVDWYVKEPPDHSALG